jgi:hypothetical protein
MARCNANVFWRKSKRAQDPHRCAKLAALLHHHPRPRTHCTPSGSQKSASRRRCSPETGRALTHRILRRTMCWLAVLVEHTTCRGSTSKRHSPCHQRRRVWRSWPPQFRLNTPPAEHDTSSRGTPKNCSHWKTRHTRVSAKATHWLHCGPKSGMGIKPHLQNARVSQGIE